MKLKSRWIFIVGFVMPIWVHACSIVGLEHEISFAAANAELSATEVSLLTHWYLDKKKALGISELGLFATRADDDSGSVDIARARFANVDALLRSLNMSDLLVMRTHIEKSSANKNAIVVIAQPECAKTASCCVGQESR
jgi:hypothetical protein